MIARPPNIMPPTPDPAKLMRAASTARIQNAFGNGRLPNQTITPIPGPGLMRPTTVPPRMPPITPPEHITPISTGQSDGMITPMPPIADTNPGNWGTAPGPTRQPPYPAQNQVTPFPYQVFQNALRESGRGTGGVHPAPPQPMSPDANPGGFTEPPLPVNPSPPDPMVEGPHDELGDDPGGANYPGEGSNGSDGNFNPMPSETGIPVEPDPLNQNPTDPGTGPQPPSGGYAGGYSPIPGETWLGGYPVGMNPTTGNTIFDPLGYGQFPSGEIGGGEDYNDLPEPDGGSGRGGTSGGPAPARVWDAGLGRFVSYAGVPIGQITHSLMEMYRNYRMNHPSGGPGGRGGGDGNSSGGFGGSETPDERAHGDRNFTMAGGNSYYDAPVSRSHYNYLTGRYEMNRDPGSFRNNPNQGAEQQAFSPRAFGMNVGGDAGRSVNTTGPWQNRRVDPATAAALAAWSRNHTTVRQLYGGG